MADPAPGHHPVHVTRDDHLIGTDGIAVPEAALEQVGHGAQPDMGMRAHVDPVAGQQFRRAHLVEEDEGADHLPSGRGQGAAHLEAADVAAAGDDEGFQRRGGDQVGVGQKGVGIPAHGGLL